uniref:Uncharacterized protein n=1 Tax=Plectus sambesii TaxID=2011161 RepID=A0A914XFI0_9BILA
MARATKARRRRRPYPTGSASAIVGPPATRATAGKQEESSTLHDDCFELVVTSLGDRSTGLLKAVWPVRGWRRLSSMASRVGRHSSQGANHHRSTHRPHLKLPLNALGNCRLRRRLIFTADRSWERTTPRLRPPLPSHPHSDAIRVLCWQKEEEEEVLSVRRALVEGGRAGARARWGFCYSVDVAVVGRPWPIRKPRRCARVGFPAALQLVAVAHADRRREARTAGRV